MDVICIKILLNLKFLETCKPKINLQIRRQLLLSPRAYFTALSELQQTFQFFNQSTKFSIYKIALGMCMPKIMIGHAIFEVQKLRLLPYMVAWISTGKEPKILLNLLFLYTKNMLLIKLGVVFLFANSFLVCKFLKISNLKGFWCKLRPFPVEIHITIYGNSPYFRNSKMGR